MSSYYLVYDSEELAFQSVNSSFHSSWKVTKPLYETEAKVDLAQFEKWK